MSDCEYAETGKNGCTEYLETDAVLADTLPAAAGASKRPAVQDIMQCFSDASKTAQLQTAMATGSDFAASLQIASNANAHDAELVVCATNVSLPSKSVPSLTVSSPRVRRMPATVPAAPVRHARQHQHCSRTTLGFTCTLTCSRCEPDALDRTSLPAGTLIIGQKQVTGVQKDGTERLAVVVHGSGARLVKAGADTSAAGRLHRLFLTWAKSHCVVSVSGGEERILCASAGLADDIGCPPSALVGTALSSLIGPGTRRRAAATLVRSR